MLYNDTTQIEGLIDVKQVPNEFVWAIDLDNLRKKWGYSATTRNTADDMDAS